MSLSFKELIKTNMLPALGVTVDPVSWLEENFGVELYSNQIKNVQNLFDPNVTLFSVLAVRGGGKTLGVSWGLAAYLCLHPGLRVIVVGPKEKQAGRLIKEIEAIFKSKHCKVGHLVDWARSSALRLQMKDGGYVVGLSGQIGANIEGEHGHILVIDEAHLVPTYSVTNKLTPMIGMLEFSKTVKIGVAMNRNHFYKSCVSPKAIVDKCPWDKAEIFLDKNKPQIFYRKKPYAKALIDRMPIPYKKKYFPDRPDLQAATGSEISVLDWETQYELMWAEDVQNFLSDEEQAQLASGKHGLLLRGLPGDLYYAGLDTAQGSLTGRKGTDETVLSIFKREGQVSTKVATYIWKGDPLAQKDEIWEILNPKDGLFRTVRFVLVDYSNIGVDIVEVFKRMGVPIAGKLFGAAEPKSKKNWKNAMFDFFQVQLQTGNIFYPNIEELEVKKISAEGDELVQVRNCLHSFGEWCILQRIRGKGLNDTICAPEDNVDGEEGTSEGKPKDDAVCADVLATWAAYHEDELRQELAKGGDLSTYQIPMGAIGMSTMSSPSTIAPRSTNPFAAPTQLAPVNSPTSSGGSARINEMLAGLKRK